VALLGTPVRRVEDPRMLTGRATYVADLDLPGALVATFVTSTVAHAELCAVDLSGATQMPGVVAGFTAADIDLPPVPPLNPAIPAEMSVPVLASGRVRYVGEPVAVIVAESAAESEDAAGLVEVDYRPLPVVVDPEDALRDEVVLFPDAGTNLAISQSGGSEPGQPSDDEVVAVGRFVNQRIAPCPLEGRAAASTWEDGRLLHWSSCQGPHPVRNILASLYGLEHSSVRVIAPDVGGSFGAKARPYVEELLLPWLSRAIGRPVRWVPPRSTDMVGLGHSRGQVQTIEVRGLRDGTITAVRAHILSDAGAYPRVAPLLAANTGQLSGGAYSCPAVSWSSTSVVTNTTPMVAFRGAGRPEAGAMIERAMDLFASEIGMDPVEVRRHNLIRSEAFPYRTATGLTHDSGAYHSALDLALQRAGYEDLREEQARRRATGDTRALGIGVATFVDRTAGIPDSEYGAVELRTDGGLMVRTGSSPYGQGHHTAWAMIASDRTGIPLEMIEVVHGNTDLIPRGGLTGGSRSAVKAGSAVAQAAEALVEAARESAATELEAAPEDIVFSSSDGGRFHVAGTPAVAIGWREIASRSTADPLSCESDFTGEGATFPFGAYVAVVEVDTETGEVELLRMISVDDAGTVLNPLLALGQVHGGIAQGIAQALWEQMVYDPDGNPLTSTFADYALPSAAELPSLECELVETPSPLNPLGVKGIAESGVIGAPPAVQNAVVDALSHLGIKHIDMPITSERVWKALNAEGSGELGR
jgi:carbon-monoxide dehydrogenase large subunit